MYMRCLKNAMPINSILKTNMINKILPIVIIIVVTFCGCTNKFAQECNETKLLMDTVCTVKVSGKDCSAATNAVFDKIAEIADKTDYYSETSKVSEFNKLSSGEKIALDDDLYKIIDMALSVSEKSDGAFDITVAPIKDLWQFSDGSHEPPSKDTIDNALKNTGYRNLVFDRENRTLSKNSDNIKIDLGGVAKGYAADCAVEILKQYNLDNAIIDLGGNVTVYGKNPSRRDGKWNIAIQKPFGKNGEYADTVTVEKGAVVTSGNYQRYFIYDDRVYHHIIDTKTGYPSDSGISSATIISDSALLADCLSTACMVLGKERGKMLADEFGVSIITVN